MSKCNMRKIEMESQENFTSSQNSAGSPSSTAIRESEMQLQSSETTTSTTQLLERNVKQIQIKEESTVKKVLKTREVKHFNSMGQEVSADDFNFDDTNLRQDEAQTSITQKSKPTNPSYDTDQPPSQTFTADEPMAKSSDTTGPSRISNLEQQTLSRPNEPSYDRGLNFQNNNYQNLMSDNTSSANMTGLISNQNDNSYQPNNYLQQMPRVASRNSNIHPSGYEELDSTLGLSNPQVNMRGTLGELGTLPASYSMKQAMAQNQALGQSPATMVKHDLIQHNGVIYPSNRSNYDMAYGSTGTVGQLPIITNGSGIYGTRQTQEPVYAINRNGNLTLVTQPNADDGDEVRWRNPELEEVIAFFSSPDPLVRANSIAYLQHLSYSDDRTKQRARLLGAIPRLIDLLNRDSLEVQRKVCGALRNLSYGRQNDDNKRAIRDSSGVQSLINALITNPDNEIRELATSVLWNLSSCEDVKWSIIEDALDAIVSIIVVPYTEWFKANLSNAQQFLPTASETHWSTVFRNATGIVRNISSAGAHARKRLRDCEGLIESLFFIINASITKNDVENKLVENCVCILRNLSYRCQETQDPDYDKHTYKGTNLIDSSSNSVQNSPSSPSSTANLTASLVNQVSSRVTGNLGCFNFGRRSKNRSKSSLNSSRKTADQTSNSINDSRAATLLPPHHPSNLQANGQSATMLRTSTQVNGFGSSSATLPRSAISAITTTGAVERPSGRNLLWQPDVAKPYLALLSGCSNSETLEAAAGAIQNLAACYWQPSIDIRAAVRKERGLPVLVELLRMDRDRVVCVVATALRNLAIDQKNKELIGKYAMPDLVSKLGNDQELPASDDTIAAVLATLHEVISNNADFVRSLYESGGLNKLTYIVKNRPKYSVRVQRFAAQVLLDMWKCTELRELYKRAGWKESHFVVRAPLSSKSSTYSVNSNTIERPMSSQQADRSSSVRNLRAISTPIPLENNPNNFNGSLGQNHLHDVQPAYGTVQMTAMNGHIGSPQALYAQVDRARKRYDPGQQAMVIASNDC